MALTALELSRKYDLSTEESKVIVDRISKGEVTIIALSGKIGSGKDSVASAFNKTLSDDSLVISEFFARPLKSEITEICSIIKYSAAFEESVDRVSKEMNVSLEAAKEISTILYRTVKLGETTTGYDRNEFSRKALQYWGTEVRRSQDDLYWVKKTLSNCVSSALQDNHRNIYITITDARFPNEVAAARDLGAIAVRLLVSPKVQSERIMGRDNVQVSEDARNHISETSLDSYKEFDLIIDTDYNNVDSIVTLIKENA